MRNPGQRRPARRMLGHYLGMSGALVLGACGSAEDPPDEVQSPALSGPGSPSAKVGTPVRGADITNGSLPPLPGQTSNVAAGYMTTWPELAGEPTNLDEGWYSLAIGDQYSTPRVFESQLRSAVSQANTIVKDGTADVSKALATVSKFLPNANVTETDYRTFGYTPERARWLKKVSTGGADGNLYDDPPAFGEMRDRGMRFYCAAKSAIKHQSDSTQLMGETSIVDTKILGQPLKLLTIEPTLTMQNPLRIDSGSEDGAQAFVLPFTAGLRITPVSFLPSLPELRVPVAMISADGEVLATEHPTGIPGPYATWLTMSHVDGFASAGRSVSASTGKFLLFPIGPISVYGEIKVDLGFAACTTGDTYPSCKSKGAQQVGRMVATLQDASGAITPLPAREGGWTTPGFNTVGAYTDAPWDIDTNLWVGTPRDGFRFSTKLPDPLAMRMLENNDKSLEVQSDATIRFDLSAGAAYKYKDWLVIGATVGGNLGAGATLIHRFREQQEQLLLPPRAPEVGEEFPPTETPAMVNTVTVTPVTAGHFDFGTTAQLQLEIKKVPIIGSLKLKLDVWDFSKSVPLGGRKAWPEANRLRMDNAISDATNANFNTVSHWPGSDAFPSYEAWDACQPADQNVTQPPPACAAREPAEGTFAKNISVPLCFYTPSWDFPPDYTTGPELDCLNALRPLLTGGTNKRQEWQGRTVDAHLIDTSTPAAMEAEWERIKTATDACVQAFGNAGRTDEGVDRIQIGVCNKMAELTDKVFEAELDTSTPSLGGSGAAGPCY